MTKNEPYNFLVSGAFAVANRPTKVVRKAIRKYTRFFDEDGTKNSKPYKDGRWDGYVNLMVDNENGIIFPSGLIDQISARLRKKKVNHAINYRFDALKEPVTLDDVPEDFLETIKLRLEQREAVVALANHVNGRARLPTASGKTAVIAALAKLMWIRNSWRTLVVTSSAGLAPQNAQEFRRFLGEDMDVSVFGGGKKNTSGHVISATSASASRGLGSGIFTMLSKNAQQSEHKPIPKTHTAMLNCEVLIFDEGHHVGASTWCAIAEASKAYHRYAVSGTTETYKTTRDKLARALCGPVRYRKSASDMVAANRVKKPKIAFINTPCPSNTPPPVARHYYKKLVAAACEENIQYARNVADTIGQFEKAGRITLLVCRSLSMLTAIQKQLEKRGTAYEKIVGSTPIPVRLQIKDRVKSRKTRVLISSSVFDEGEDVPSIDAVVIAIPEKSAVKSLQRIGRGMRIDGDVRDLWVAVMGVSGHRVFDKQNEQLKQYYRKEGYAFSEIKSTAKDRTAAYRDKGGNG